MKSNGKFPKDWQIIMFAAVLFFLALQACTTTKQLHSVATTEQIKANSTEETKTNTGAETNTQTKITAETDITEKCDTLVPVRYVVNGELAAEPVYVPIKFVRTTHRKEYTEQTQEKKEETAVTVTSKKQVAIKNDAVLKDRAVTRSGITWWMIAIAILAILEGIAVYIFKKKLFFW